MRITRGRKRENSDRNEGAGRGEVKPTTDFNEKRNAVESEGNGYCEGSIPNVFIVREEKTRQQKNIWHEYLKPVFENSGEAQKKS